MHKIITRALACLLCCALPLSFAARASEIPIDHSDLPAVLLSSDVSRDGLYDLYLALVDHRAPGDRIHLQRPDGEARSFAAASLKAAGRANFAESARQVYAEILADFPGGARLIASLDEGALIRARRALEARAQLPDGDPEHAELLIDEIAVRGAQAERFRLMDATPAA